MMRYIIITICFVSVIFSACTKKSDSAVSDTNKIVSESSAFINGGDFMCNLTMHRANGEKKGGPWAGASCDCVLCFGVCFAVGISDDNDDLSMVNSIIEDLGNNSAKIYILEQPDDDVQVDPTCYIDDDVVISLGTESITLSSGEYSYYNTSGNLLYNNNSFSYYGYIIVDYN